jgi:hypothetical protein
MRDFQPVPMTSHMQTRNDSPKRANFVCEMCNTQVDEELGAMGQRSRSVSKDRKRQNRTQMTSPLRNAAKGSQE